MFNKAKMKMNSANSGENCIDLAPNELSSSGNNEIAINMVGSVPFLAKPQLLDSIMCRQTIGPRCKLGLKFRVTRLNQELRWRLRALKGKMTFAIYRQKIATISSSSVQNNSANKSSIQNLMSESRGM